MGIAAGSPAPGFTATDDRGATTSLAELTAGGPVVLAFFKASCPTCQLAFPVFAELGRRHGDTVPFVAVAQDPAKVARPWLDERGFAGPVLDDSHGYPVSAAYDLDSVPTLVLVDGDGTVVDTAAGWDRDVVNAWDARLAAMTGREAVPVSEPGDGRPPWKPG